MLGVFQCLCLSLQVLVMLPRKGRYLRRSPRTYPVPSLPSFLQPHPSGPFPRSSSVLSGFSVAFSTVTVTSNIPASFSSSLTSLRGKETAPAMVANGNTALAIRVSDEHFPQRFCDPRQTSSLLVRRLTDSTVGSPNQHSINSP